MTQEDIISMYKQANGWCPTEWDETVKELERFAELVAEAEREACAKVCEPQEQHDDPLTAWKIAAAIRARRLSKYLEKDPPFPLMP